MQRLIADILNPLKLPTTKVENTAAEEETMKEEKEDEEEEEEEEETVEAD